MSNIELICKKINSITEKYDSRDPFEICKAMDIHIYYKDLGTYIKSILLLSVAYKKI